VEEGGIRRAGKVQEIELASLVVRDVYSAEARERIVGSGSARRGAVSWRSYYGRTLADKKVFCGATDLSCLNPFVPGRLKRFGFLDMFKALYVFRGRRVI
jgi:hypothetical protein